jgi:hypothetical protein
MISDWNAPAGWSKDIFGRTVLAGLIVLALFLPPLLIFLLIAAIIGLGFAAAPDRARVAVPDAVSSPMRRLAPRAPPLI